MTEDRRPSQASQSIGHSEQTHHTTTPNTLSVWAYRLEALAHTSKLCCCSHVVVDGVGVVQTTKRASLSDRLVLIWFGSLHARTEQKVKQREKKTGGGPSFFVISVCLNVSCPYCCGYLFRIIIALTEVHVHIHVTFIFYFFVLFVGLQNMQMEEGEGEAAESQRGVAKGGGYLLACFDE